MTRLTIISFSAGLDSAIMTVRATSVWSAMRLEPSLRSSRRLRLRNVEEKRGGDALVAVREAVVLRDEVEEVRGLLLRGGIEIFAAERLVHRAEGGLERAVLLVAEE